MFWLDRLISFPVTLSMQNQGSDRGQPMDSETVRTDSFLQGYDDVMRLDFAITPAQDAVVLAGKDMVVVTLDQTPDSVLLRELNDLRVQVSPSGRLGGDRELSESFTAGQRSFYLPLSSTYCPDKTAEAIASELEGRYGMTVLRKRKKTTKYDREFAPQTVKQFKARADSVRSDSFSAGYADVMQYDAKGEGTPCGRGWISPAKKCSAEKRKSTSKKNKRKFANEKRKKGGLSTVEGANQRRRSKKKSGFQKALKGTDTFRAPKSKVSKSRAGGSRELARLRGRIGDD